MYYRYGATPRDKFFMNIRYYFRMFFRPAMEFIDEAVVGFIWIFGAIFLLPILAACFH